MKWPNSKQFAFTIIDDTDGSTIENTKPVYEFLHSLGFKTTKTVWVYPPRDEFSGSSLQDPEYLSFVKDLHEKGFEIGLHNVGSGRFLRDEIIEGVRYFKGLFPDAKIHVNHSRNPCNLYWGYERFYWLKPLFRILGKGRKFSGSVIESDCYWADVAKSEFKYIRNLVFNGANTLGYDPTMPYISKNKPESNYWFSSSDGHTIDEFLELTKPDNLERLKASGGACIVYTHFASGFVESSGNLNPDFVKRMKALSEMNGYFEPASTILDYLLKEKKGAREVGSLLESFFLESR
ncbi:TPA: hypothetical protein PX784_003552, partial [Vibrio cholerae]|nr:hypothetical protein [Vibrio cholerae]